MFSCLAVMQHLLWWDVESSCTQVHSGPLVKARNKENNSYKKKEVEHRFINFTYRKKKEESVKEAGGRCGIHKFINS